MFKIVILVFLIRNLGLECSEDSFRMINGKVIDIKDRPYQVAINVRHIRFIYAECHCGGAIISVNYILTAGHCVDSDEFTYVVRVGTSECTWWGDVYSIKNIILHPSFQSDPELISDLAILEIDTEIRLTESVQPIVMSDESFDPSDLYVEISGYGRTSFDGTNSDQLMAIEETVLSLDECHEYKSDVKPDTLCHIDRKNRWTSCKGDSGGPVILVGTQKMLVGILSRGIKCDVKDITTSSSIPTYRKWIRSMTKV